MELSNSQVNLLTTKIRDISKNDITTKELIDYVREKCQERGLSLDKVCEELLSAIDKTSNIRNISPFVKAIVSRLDQRLFKEDKLRPNFVSLTRALKQNGIVGETWELVLVQLIEEHALNEFKVSINDLVATNRAIVEYCKNKELKTLQGFKELLLKSRVLKQCNIPIVVLEKQAKEIGNDLDKTTTELEELDLYGTPEDN